MSQEKEYLCKGLTNDISANVRLTSFETASQHREESKGWS